MAVPERVASELVTQVDKFLEILCLVHRPQRRLLSQKAQGGVVRSQGAISPQDRAGAKEGRPGKIIEGKRDDRNLGPNRDPPSEERRVASTASRLRALAR